MLKKDTRSIWRKRLSVLCAVLLLCALLCGCGNKTDTPKEEDGEPSTPAAVWPSAAWEEDDALKILGIGNSFTVDSMEYVYQIAQSVGIEKITLGSLVIGGCTLDTHANNIASGAAAYEYRTNTDGKWKSITGHRIQEAVQSDNWDFIMLQQASAYSGMPASYNRLTEIIDAVKSWANEDAKLVWNMTWAYQQSCTDIAFARYNNDQKTMFDAIASTVQSKILPQKNLEIVIPNGTAIQNARSSFMGDTLTRDGMHLHLKQGRYIAGMGLFCALTGCNADGVPYAPSGVSSKMQQAVAESVTNALKMPYTVTNSQYTA